MSSTIACFLIGLILGIIGAGYMVYKVEEDKILTIKAADQTAIINAQNNALRKQSEGAAISQKVSAEYESKIAALNAALASRKLQAGSKRSVSPVSQPATGTDATCQLVKIQLSSLQEWISQQITAFNH